MPADTVTATIATEELVAAEARFGPAPRNLKQEPSLEMEAYIAEREDGGSHHDAMLHAVYVGKGDRFHLIPRRHRVHAQDECTEEQLKRYVDLRHDGNSHNMAMILACKQPPLMDRTDERLRLGDDGGIGHIHAGLAEYPGDESARVESRGDIERIAKARGWKVSTEPPKGGNQENFSRRAE